MDKKIPLLVIAGPTASGKTAVAVQLAKLYNGEVVSADSMQIYKGLDICTAKPNEKEMQGVKHHLVGIIDDDCEFSVADFVKLAGEAINDIYSRGKLPILCGGTGLYISSLIENVKFDDTGSDRQIRTRLLEEARLYGNHALWEKLNEVDAETAAKVHENNLSRVVRGLEVYEITGVPLSQHKINSRLEETPYCSCVIGLMATDRQYIYDRINKRVDEMVENGMVEECREFYETKTPSTAFQAIGYKELIPYFENKEGLDVCIDKIKQETRHYAKRQLTWFRRVDGISWVMTDEFGNSKKIIENIKNIIAKSEIMCYNII